MTLETVQNSLHVTILRNINTLINVLVAQKCAEAVHDTHVNCAAHTDSIGRNAEYAAATATREILQRNNIGQRRGT